MSSEKIVQLLDVIIFIMGIMVIYQAVRMKKTGIPSQILIPKEEQPVLKHAKEFCSRMYQPTILFGSIISLYGAADIVNRRMFKVPAAEFLLVACFLAASFWYIRRLRKVKEEHI